MSYDFTVPYSSGFTAYSLTGDGQGNIWDGSAFISPFGNRPACAGSMTYDGTLYNSVGGYGGDLPSGLIGGTYPVGVYIRLGASPADNDPAIAFGYVPTSGSGSSAPATTALFEIALVADLKTDSVLSAIVGPRVFPRKVPEAAVNSGASVDNFPCLVYAIGRKSHERNLAGPCGIARCRVLIHCKSRDALQAKGLAEQLRLKYDGLRGSLQAVSIVETILDDDPDDYAEPDDGSDAGVFTVPAAFKFRYRETPPSR